MRAFPENPLHAEELAHTYCDLGADRVRRGRLDDAEQPLRAAERMYERNLRQHALAPLRTCWLAACKQNLAHLFEAQGRLAGAEQEYRDVTRMLSELSHTHARHLGVRLALIRSYVSLAELTAPPPALPVTRGVIHSQRRWFSHLGASAPPEFEGDAPATGIPDCERIWELEGAARAIAACEAARELARPLTELFADDTDYERAFVKASVTLASIQCEAGDDAAAITTLRDCVAVGDDHPLGYAFLAYHLCEAKDPGARDRAEALRVAQQGVRLHPERWYTWLVLGLTRLRERQFGGAAQALQEALSRPHRESDDLIELYLAIALWEQGDPDGATGSFARAIHRIEQAGTRQGTTLRSARAEAAERLGLADTPPYARAPEGR